ncbi:MAG: hypothetical protein MJZ32_06355 [Bacteroidaceae bacterium]|nr:hypothetical protein [Bacteroidaceae bacterium]
MKHFILMIFTLLSLFSCATAKKAPVNSMTSYSYSYSSSPAYNHNEYSAKLLEDGSCQIGFAHNEQGDTIIVGGDVMKQIEAIYRKHKIYNYKNKYTPAFEVLDGDSWYYSAYFGKESFSSSGSNAGPSDRGLSEINNVIINLLRKNYSKQYCGSTWQGKIKDNDLNVMFTEKDSVVSVSIQLSNGEGTWLSVAGDLEAYNDALASFHGQLKNQLVDTPKPVVTCVDVYVKPEAEEISISLSGNDMTPLIQDNIEGATWEDHSYIPMKKINQ